jgi:hypothetical protein
MPLLPPPPSALQSKLVSVESDEKPRSKPAVQPD